MGFDRACRLAEGALILLFVSAAFVLVCQELDDADIWWHLKAGRWIWTRGKVPTNDPFTFTSSDRPWIDLHWLFQLMLAGAFAAGGVRVREDVAVVGVDDIDLGSLCDPSLTSVHQPLRILGERACARLLDRIADPGLKPTVELLPTELVPRSSCGCSGRARQPVPPLQADRAAAPGRRPARRATRIPAKA
jgi:hypothetical protein